MSTQEGDDLAPHIRSFFATFANPNSEKKLSQGEVIIPSFDQRSGNDWGNANPIGAPMGLAPHSKAQSAMMMPNPGRPAEAAQSRFWFANDNNGVPNGGPYASEPVWACVSNELDRGRGGGRLRFKNVDHSNHLLVL